MILIFGSNNYDQGMDPVMDWLTFYDAEFVKISNKSLFSASEKSINFNFSDGQLVYDNIDLNEKINVIWNRRMEIFHPVWRNNLHLEDHPLVPQIDAELTRENRHLLEYLYFRLDHKKWLPKDGLGGMNKLKILTLAQHVGISIPATQIISTKKDLVTFLKLQGGKLITKPISDSFYYRIDQSESYLAYTALIKQNDLSTFDDYFYPSLFQQCIVSDTELRIFFLDGLFFCQAAMTRTTIETEEIIDLKQRRDVSRVDHVRYELPQPIKDKLTNLMKKLDLNMGCIDMLLTPERDYIFLEVNSGGQYLFESQKCNFNIEKQIALWLINNDRKQS